MHADVGHVTTGPHELGAQLEAGRYTDRLDGHVRSEPVGQVPHEGDGVFPGVVDHQVGAEQLRRLETGVGQVDGDDPARRVQLSAEYGGEPDGAGADHDDRVARLDLPVEHTHLIGGGEDVGQHEDLLVGRAVGYPERGGVGERHANVLGLGAVDRVAEDPAAAGLALPVAGLAAEPACPARADAGDQHTVARRERTDAVADLVDGPDRLVTQNPAVAHLRQVALENVQVGTADRGRIHLHDNVAVIGDLGVGYLVPGLAAGTVVNEGSHAASTCWLSSAPKPARERSRGPGPKVHFWPISWRFAPVTGSLLT